MLCRHGFVCASQYIVSLGAHPGLKLNCRCLLILLLLLIGCRWARAQIWITGVSWFFFSSFLQKEVATTLWWARRCDSGTRRERKRGCQKSSKAIGQWVWSFQKINNGSVRWETLGAIKPYRHREVSIVWGDVSMVWSWLITRSTNYLECCYILPKKFNGPSLFYILNLTIAYSVAGLEKIVS